MRERAKLALLAAVYAACALVPFAHAKVRGAALEAFLMLREYAREHVLTCLVPAFFIAGAISVLLSKEAVLRLLGARARRIVAYSVASAAGTILAVCSCTVLPLFASIYRRGAGLGPAAAFLYSGPAINVLAIVLTARVLGFEIGVARAAGAVLFAIVVGLLMALLFRREEAERASGPDPFAAAGAGGPPVYRGALLVLALAGVLVSSSRWWLAGAFLAVALILAFRWFSRDERTEWVLESWGFAKQILPLLLAGVLAAGFLLGRPGSDAGLVPSHVVERLVGGNSLGANFFASVFGALMYFATLTEVPILQGLIGQGMGKGPALALLLSGPSVSLPSLLVIRTVLGTKKTLAYAAIVVVLSTLSGFLFGAVAG